MDTRLFGRLMKAVIVAMVFAPCLAQASTSFVRPHISTSSFNWCTPGSYDSYYVNGDATFDHLVTCPNGNEVLLDEVWVPFQYSSGCAWGCDGSANPYVYSWENQWIAHLEAISKGWEYWGGEYTCMQQGNYYYGDYSFNKTDSSDVPDCQ